MGVYKRGDTWGISYFHNGKRIRKAIGANKKKAEAELEAIRVDIRGGRYKEPRRDSFDALVEEYERLQNTEEGVPVREVVHRTGEGVFQGRGIWR